MGRRETRFVRSFVVNTQEEGDVNVYRDRIEYVHSTGSEGKNAPLASWLCDGDPVQAAGRTDPDNSLVGATHR